MEKLVESGKARSIGLSNFNIIKTRRVLEVAKITPAVNQVEIHPYHPQYELFDFSSKHGILLMAHQPLGGRPVGVVRAHPDVPFPTEDPTVRLCIHHEHSEADARIVDHRYREATRNESGTGLSVLGRPERHSCSAQIRPGSSHGGEPPVEDLAKRGIPGSE